MERKPNFNLPPTYGDVGKIPVAPLRETPRQNGSKPAQELRIAEQCKKHITKDGKR